MGSTLDLGYLVADVVETDDGGYRPGKIVRSYRYYDPAYVAAGQRADKLNRTTCLISVGHDLTFVVESYFWPDDEGSR